MASSVPAEVSQHDVSLDVESAEESTRVGTRARKERESSHDGAPSMTLFLASDIGLDLQFRCEALELIATKEVVNFNITGPDDKLQLLQRGGIHLSDLHSFISPPHKISISDADQKEAMGIPSAAAYYSFIYPVPGQDEEVKTLHPDSSTQWVYLLVLGGYVYFDHEGAVVRVNALTPFISETRVFLDGPFTVDCGKAVLAMSQQQRMMKSTLDALVKVGFTHFGWVHPNEALHDVKLGTRSYPHGAFLYKTSKESRYEGRAVYFLLNMDHMAKKLYLATDIGLTIEFPEFKERPTELLKIRRLVKYAVVGPLPKLKELERGGIGLLELQSFISPPNRITLNKRQRRRAGIPLDASAFSFVYPLKSQEKLKKLAAGTVQWLSLLQFGGYIYLNGDGRVIMTNALSLQGSSRQCLYLDGPVAARPGVVQALQGQSRMMDTTLEPHIAAGFSSFGWVNPEEKISGKMLGKRRYESGAFVYATTPDSPYAGNPVYFILKGDEEAKRTRIDFQKLYPEGYVERSDPILLKKFATLVSRVPHWLQRYLILGFITLVPLFFVTVVAICLMLLVLISYWSRGGVAFQFCATLCWLLLLTYMIWKLLKDTASELLSRSPRFRQLIWAVAWIATMMDLVVRAASQESTARHNTRIVTELTLLFYGVLLPIMLYARGKMLSKIIGVKDVGVHPRTDAWKQVARMTAFVRVDKVMRHLRSRSSTTRAVEAPVLRSTEKVPKVNAVQEGSAGLEQPAAVEATLESPNEREAASKGSGEREIAAACAVQRVWRGRLCRSRHSNSMKILKSLQCERVKQRLTAFSWPIFFATVVNVIGNIVVDHTNAARNASEAHIGEGRAMTFFNVWWLALLVPCQGVLFLIDARKRHPPQKSTAHVIFFVMVLYLATYKVAMFTPWMYEQVVHSLEPDSDAGGAAMEIAGFTAKDLAPTISMIIHIMIMAMLIRTGRTTLNFITAPNTLTYFLFPFQFFDFAFNNTFFGLIGAEGISGSWLLQQFVLQVWCFCRNSGLFLGLQNAAVKKARIFATEVLACARDKWQVPPTTQESPVPSTDTGSSLWVSIKRLKSISISASRTQRLKTKVKLSNPFLDPVFKLMYVGTMAVQYDIAEICAIFLVPIAAEVFLKLLSTTLARLWLIRTMRLQILAKRTIHGTSTIAAQINSGRAAAPDCPLEELANQEMQKVLNEHAGTPKDHDLLSRELSLSNLNYTLLARRKLARHGLFYLIVMLFTLFATLPVARLVPSAELKRWYGNYSVPPNATAMQVGAPSIIPDSTQMNRFDAVQYHLMWEYVDPTLSYSLDADLRNAFEASSTLSNQCGDLLDQ